MPQPAALASGLFYSMEKPKTLFRIRATTVTALPNVAIELISSLTLCRRNEPPTDNIIALSENAIARSYRSQSRERSERVHAFAFRNKWIGFVRGK